jgi:hypothetical protein
MVMSLLSILYQSKNLWFRSKLFLLLTAA